MKFVSGVILGVSVLAGLLTAVSVRAEDAPAPGPTPAAATCEVPDYLLSTDNALTRVAEAIKSGGSLNILVIGSRSSTINVGANASEAAAYPGQMQAALKEKLPSITVNVSVEIQAKKTAEEVATSLPKLLESKKPTLVVWQTGTVDAMRSVDPEDFRTGVSEGVVALQEAGADVILINPQYSPRTESMISASPYLDNMRVVAQEHDVPLFDRFAIMRNWSESGDFDLFTAVHGSDLAKRVHNCLGRALSQFIIDAAHPKPVQEN
jgi:lysophospholipase L1-like esterase